ncbi:uncharacterized protein LOC107633134 [Arachis ipaensis]|uniref:uncharacterized protein LOC107633134 n=1 Tax=Arachis ipaensis TaxID=130454 RepID=UPI0007AFDC41|nr:uncharacterized protein LOC107633134 [Arachis ipaensis]
MMLSQVRYIRELLLKDGVHNSKPLPTPIATDVKLFSNNSELFENPTQYRSIVGALQYLTMIKLDITFAINRISQFVHDADWGGDLEDRKSIFGFCVYLGNNLISWKSNKQTKVNRSSTEAEYRAMCAAQTEIMSLQQLLQELRIPQIVVPTIYCDNQSDCLLAANSILLSKCKHLELDLHFLRNLVNQKALYIMHIPSSDQITDCLTKSMSQHLFDRYKHKLRVFQNPYLS